MYPNLIRKTKPTLSLNSKVSINRDGTISKPKIVEYKPFVYAKPQSGLILTTYDQR